MSAYPVSLANRRLILLAVMSLIASLLTVGFNAPRANAAAGVFDQTSVAVTEGTGSATYNVRLDSAPLDTVTIDLIPDNSEVTAVAAADGFSTTLTFLIGDWNVDQSVTVTAVDDNVDDDLVNDNISHIGDSNDATFAIDLGDMPVTITDNDATPALTITSETSLDESGDLTFEVGRTGTVDTLLPIAFSYTTTSTGSASEGTDYGGVANTNGVIPATGGTFDIVVPITTDFFDETDETFEVSATVTSSNASNPANGVGTITDDDTRGISVSPGTIGVTEGGAASGYTVTLDSRPTADVTVNVSNTTGEATATPSSVILTPTTWSTGAPITVTAVDDPAIDGATTDTINNNSTSTGDPNYNGFTGDTVAVNVTDNDSASIAITPLVSTAAENGTDASYQISLTSQPASDVTINITTDADTTAVGSVTFTNAIWGPKTVIVTAFDDTFIEGAHTGTITHSITPTSDPDYVALPDPVDFEVTITDNEIATASFTLSGDDAPEEATPYTAEVTLITTAGTTLESPAVFTINDDTGLSGLGDYTIPPGPVTFIAGSGNGATQSVSVAIINDTDHEPAQLFDMSLVYSAGAASVGGTPTHTTTIVDNDNVIIAFSNSVSSLTEAGVTHNVPLKITVPGGGSLDSDVTVTIPSPTGTAMGGGTDYTLLSTPTVTFNAGAVTNDTVNVQLAVVGDPNHEPNETVGLAMNVTGGPGQSGTPATHTVTINDNDPVTVAFASATSSVAENVVGTYSPQLNLTIPGGGTLAYPVTVTVPTPDGTADNPADYTVTLPVTIPATTAAGNVNSVIIDPFDDPLVDPDETIILTIDSVTGPAIVGAPTGHTVTIIDDNSPGITIVGAPDVTENGPIDSFTVALAQQPTGNVTVSLTEALNGDEFNINRSSIVFTNANWNTPIPVTVTPLDDNIIDGTQTGRVDLAASGPAYTGVTTDVSISIQDDDTATYTFNPAAVTVTEGTGSAAYLVVLDARPSQDVSVNLTTTGEVTVNPTSIVFTSGNWNTPRSVTVTAVDDDLVDGNLADTVLHTASSTDADFNGIISGLTATANDNDSAGLDVDVVDALAVIEGGATDTYTVALTAEPLNDVVVTITTDGQTTVSPSSLTFTSANWASAQAVMVTAVDDGIPEPSHADSQITHAVASDDPTFDAIPDAVLAAAIGDAGALLTSLEGPTRGAPGVAAIFTATVNAGGVGALSYDWQVFLNGVLTGITGPNQSTFAFTPDQGGVYNIRAVISDNNGQNPPDFVTFTVMGDVAGSVFVNDIIWLAEEGVTKGCNQAGTLFCPDDFVTRGQMAAFLVRFLGLTDNGGGDLFIDDDNSIFKNDIDRLATAGITKGCNPGQGNTKYCPDDLVTRGQMAAFLVRALGLTDAGAGNLFTDDDGSIFEANIDRLATAGITKGCNPGEGNTKYCPDAFVTRGQMAAFLRRASLLLGA